MSRGSYLFQKYPGGVLPAVQTRSERLHGVRKNSAHYARNHAVGLAVDRPATSGGAYSHGCTKCLPHSFELPCSLANIGEDLK